MVEASTDCGGRAAVQAEIFDKTMTRFRSLVADCAAFTVVGWLTLNSGSATPTAAGADTITRSFAVETGAKLTLEADRGSVHVAAGEDGKITVVVKRDVRRASDAEAAEVLKQHAVSMTQEGNEVRVTAKTGKLARSSWFGQQPNLEVRFEITVPKGAAVDLTTAAGSVEVSGLAGPVVATSSAGSLAFRQLQGPVKGRTAAGSIKASDCGAKLDLRSSAGSIDLVNFTGPTVQAETAAGSISADLAAAPEGDCVLQSGAGSITLKLPGQTSVRLEARSSVGRVSCELPLEGKIGSDRGELRGTLNGGGPRLTLKTSAGSIRVLKR